VTATPPRADEAIRTALKRHFTDDAITEMTALIAFQKSPPALMPRWIFRRRGCAPRLTRRPMLDRHLHPRVKPALNRLVSVLDKPGITPDGLTLTGFAIGVLALPFLALGWYPAALVAIVLNRLLDGLDGRWRAGEG
jgi:hypothetical protein